MEDLLPIAIRSSARRRVWESVGALALVSFALAWSNDGEQVDVGSSVPWIFAGVLAICVIRMLRRPVLTITDDGFTAPRVDELWRDIDGPFSVEHWDPGTPGQIHAHFVRFCVANSADRIDRQTLLNLSGTTRSIQSDFGRDPHEIADLLNAQWRRWQDRHPSTTTRAAE